ncbi:MAG: GAF domain-containing protein [Deltaproteobacteria bacterium]|nr:GAF domain-containing protein [Candidatus Anaeroferrophillus wilburensis]MBN2889121.1 GAF domain-containing protein [Deltaproteobacteria bacterium]
MYEKSIYHTKEVLASLYQISRLTTATNGRDDLIRIVLETIINGLQYDRVALYLLKEGTSILEGVSNVGCQVNIKGLKYDLYRDACVETRVVNSGEIIFIKEGCDYPFYTTVDLKRNEALKRTCCVLLPIFTNQGVVGTMLADRSQSRKDIDQDDIEILEIFCNQIGIVVENKRLLDSNRRKILELTLLQKISRSMSEPRDLESLYQVVVREATLLGKSQGSWLHVGAEGDVLTTVAVDGCQGHDVASLYVPEQVVEVKAAGRTVYRPLSVSTGSSESAAGVLAVPLMSGRQVMGILNLLYWEPGGLAGVNVDVLDIFAAQAAKAIENVTFYRHLQEERDFRENILRSTPNSIFTLDGSLRITTCNQRAQRMFSVFGDLLQRPMVDVIQDSRFRQALVQVAEGKQSVVQLEITPEKGPFQEKFFSISITALHHDWSRQHEILVLLQDQTEKTKTDREVERMKRLAAIGQLAAGIAHEIRNPLTGMNISLDIIRDQVTESEQAASLLDGVVQEIDRLETIVSSLLEFSRTGVLEKGTIHLGPVLSQWFPPFQEQCKRCQLTADLEIVDGLPPVAGDVEKLRQVVMNLGLNALEAIEGSGTVSIRAFPISASQMAVRSSSADVSSGLLGNWLGLAIADTGAGMSEEVKERIFDPFYTTKNHGTGLGLSIVHNIIKEHDGWIEVKSEPGKGSCFTIVLPAMITEDDGQDQEDVKSNTYY